jgi:hypothetical protein
MKCHICETDFSSLEWYKENFKQPLCDKCLITCFEIQKQSCEMKLNRIKDRIKFLENKIGE